MKHAILLFVAINCSWASAALKHAPSNEKIREMAKHNTDLAFIDALFPKFQDAAVTPFIEYHQTGYILFSDDDYYGMAKPMKEEIVRNLPADVQLIVYTRSSDRNHHRELKEYYLSLISEDRLHILQVPRTGMDDFWSRDNLPVPIYENGKFALVDAQYYYNFEPDAFLGQTFGANVLKHSYFYEGGNFSVSGRGDCVVVNRKETYPGGTSDTAAIPDDIFYLKYGCKTLTRLEHLKGIGHSDEVIKFLNDDTVLTDTEAYKPILENLGYRVLMLPEPEMDFETYANSLIVNGTVYVPVFGEEKDQEVISLYEQFGFKTVPIQSRELATEGQGGIHCITMNYPAVPFPELVKRMKATIIH